MTTKNSTGTQVWGLLMWLYRAVLVGFSGWYTLHSLRIFHDWNVVSNFSYLTQVTAALVFGYYVVWLVRALLRGAGRTSDSSGEVRGFVVMLAMLVGVLFNTMLGPVETWPSTVAHVIIPVMAVGDWLLFGRGQGRIRNWMPLVWVLCLVPYVIFYWWYSVQPGNLPPYAFLDPAKLDFYMWLGIMLIAFIVGAYVVYGLGKVVAMIHGRRR